MYVNIAHRYDGVGQRNQIDLKKKKNNLASAGCGTQVRGMMSATLQHSIRFSDGKCKISTPPRSVSHWSGNAMENFGAS